MPHIVIHYSHGLDETIHKGDVLKALHNDLATRESVTISAIKTYALPMAECVVGAPDTSQNLVHIILKLLPGRDVDLKNEMIQGLRAIVRSHAPEYVVTAEVQELDAQTYSK